MKKTIFFVAMLILFNSRLFAQQVPDVTLFDLKGNGFQTSAFTAKDNKPVVLSFWATWCIPCINELTVINDNLSEWSKQLHFSFYAISTDDSRTAKRVGPLVNGKGWDFTVLLDKNQDLKRLLNLASIPYTLVIKNGEVIYRHLGYVDGDENDLYEVLKKNQ